MSAKNSPEVFPYHHGSYLPPDARTVARRAEEERTLERTRQLELQTSVASSAQERIGLWERLHGVRLPAAAGHPLVSVIALHTRLSVQAVRDEQQRRGTLSE